MEPLNRSRQLDLFRPDQALSPVTVIGAGGIGSPTVLLLAKMGVPRVEVFDFDTVEEHNLPSQLYRLEDIGKTKVSAIAEIVRVFASAEIEARAERYEDQPLEGVVVCAVDSMDARLRIWEQVKLNPNIDLYVDARMGANDALLLTARPCDPYDIAGYERHLYPSSEATQVPCTARAIVYNTFGIASMVAATVRRWWIDGERSGVIRMDFASLTFV